LVAIDLELFTHLEARSPHRFRWRGRDLPPARNGRGLEAVRLGQPFLLIIGLAGRRVVAVEQSVVGEDIIFVIEEDR
jgi:hypothetical protein